jgi:hypothetical protein
MDVDEIVEALQSNIVVLDTQDNLRKTLSLTKLIKEVETVISKPIRILKYKKYFLTQETTPKNEIAYRLFPSFEEADKLLTDHLNTYEQMWNGCGCKVNYYS